MKDTTIHKGKMIAVSGKERRGKMGRGVDQRKAGDLARRY